ncbi:MAG: hypothetical protein QUS07_07335 [Methanothrix sp.]|nr:hypothetical protein [Methanothrix sp.]
MARNPTVSRVHTGENPDSLITLSTGVVLKAQTVPAMFMTDVMARVNPSKPAVPIVHIASKGRDEPNPQDPEYLEARRAWDMMVAVEINNAFILLGTTVAQIPKGFPSPDDPIWLSKMRVLKMGSDDPIERYLLWVKYTAAPLGSDIEKIIGAVGRLSGVSEEDVTEAVKNFQRNP